MHIVFTYIRIQPGLLISTVWVVNLCGAVCMVVLCVRVVGGGQGVYLVERRSISMHACVWDIYKYAC